jgi:hypothetical protein
MRLPNAKELGDFLPHWYKASDDRPSPSGYTNLKTAAIAMVRAPERERRNLISAYSWAYCEPAFGDIHRSSGGDVPRLSGMYLLLRVLFVVSAHHPIRDVIVYAPWNHPPRNQGITEWDLSYPVHIDPGERVLRIDPCCTETTFNVGTFYFALDEYDYFSTRFPRRTVADIEALDIE